MPIKPELRYFYPIDWRQISCWVRFERARGRCEACGRPHGQIVRHLGDGRWWDETGQSWRDGSGRKIPPPILAEDPPLRTTKVVLVTACCTEAGEPIGSGAVSAARVLSPCRTRPMPAAVIISLGRSGA